MHVSFGPFLPNAGCALHRHDNDNNSNKTSRGSKRGGEVPHGHLGRWKNFPEFGHHIQKQQTLENCENEREGLNILSYSCTQRQRYIKGRRPFCPYWQVMFWRLLPDSTDLGHLFWFFGQLSLKTTCSRVPMESNPDHLFHKYPNRAEGEMQPCLQPGPIWALVSRMVTWLPGAHRWSWMLTNPELLTPTPTKPHLVSGISLYLAHCSNSLQYCSQWFQYEYVLANLSVTSAELFWDRCQGRKRLLVRVIMLKNVGNWSVWETEKWWYAALNPQRSVCVLGVVMHHIGGK